MAGKKDFIIAIIAGALLVSAFPPFDFYPGAWIALAPFLVVLKGKDAKPAFLLGVASGFAYFAGTVYWVYHSMFRYGGITPAITVLAVILLCLYLSLYSGLFSLIFSSLMKLHHLPASLVAPVLWVSLEFFRTYALTGFPWSVLGYSQYKFLPLIQVADITGVYGISFLVCSFSGLIFDIVSYYLNRRGEMPVASHWPMTISIIFYTIIYVMTGFYGATRLHEEPGTDTLRVSVVQGNIPQDRKWDITFQREVIETYKRLTRDAMTEKPDLVVWPESALPFTFGYNRQLTDETIAFQKELGTYLLFGSVRIKDVKNGRARLANSAILLNPDGTIVSVYDKIHLVPYGEYVPLRSLFPFISKMVEAIGDFVPGHEPVVMSTPIARIGNLICYEIIFPGLVRKFVDRGATLLVTITNDAWFGRTSAPYQHFSMAVLRAVENRVPVARSANTGISGFINSKGQIITESDIFEEALLTEDIAPGNRKSFYTRHGDIFAYLCILSSVLLVLYQYIRGRRFVA